ncbi:MAG: DNA internalization-related competence protein ComEC/Rec2 [Gemmatimonadaceae bacterium]|nr:DNA internalization-related competence protein ComEC/Rec2 [Gemmatimonadaceae bacterium]MCW5824983.1 DNA internalization-related competence protein ComEC/Rec2 [Gemmatimonadaceae bacterium]
MPLVFIAAVVWAAGTALGLGGSAWTGALALLSAFAGLALLALAARWAVAAALGLIGAAALTLGADLRAADAACLEQARAARSWEVRLLREAAPGGFATAKLVTDACVLRVSIAVRQGRAPAGSVVMVTGAEPSAGPRGLLLRDGTVQLRRGPRPLARWRNHVAASLDRRFGERAGLARALLIADTQGLAPELRERFTDAGLVHVLAISGLHVGIIAGALLLLVEALRLPPRGGRALAVVLVALYVLAIGAPPAALRSAALFAAVSSTRWMQRPTSPWALFALAATAPLLQPRTVLELGWQLSVAGYAGVMAAGRTARRLTPERWRGWRARVLGEVMVGLYTTAATAPLVAWHFGRLSLVGVVSNLAAGPVVAVMQPTLFLAMLVPGDAIGRFVADAAAPLLGALDAVASVSAAMPFAAITVAPTFVAACIAAAAVGAAVAAAWARHWAPWATVAVALAGLLVWVPDPRLGGAGPLELHLLDVGQGDAIAVRTPRGRWVVIDAGRTWRSGDAGRSTVVPYLRRQGGALAMFVLTHPHADHVGGAASVVRALRPSELRDAAFVAGSGPYAEMLRAARDVGARWQRVGPGESVEIDGAHFDFLAPDSAWTVALSDPNEASTVLRVRYGNRRFLLTGDAEHRLEDWLLAQDPDALRADVLKAGHHGSRTSSTPAFVEAVSPRLALVSVGTANTYGHPAAEVMQRFVALGATVLRTDQLGTVIVRTDGERLEVEAAGHRWSIRERLSPLP